MKSIRATEILANIRSTFVSFFSILMFVALGVGIFLGISWAGPALQNAASDTFQKGKLHDLQIQFPYGLTDEDLAELKQVEGVTQVEGQRQAYETVRLGDAKRMLKVHSLGESVNTPIVIEGELPTEPDQMAFHHESANDLGVRVGDVIEMEQTDDADPLTPRTFTVTAIIDGADYVGRSSATYGYSNAPSGAVDALAWVPGSAFDAAAFNDGYPTVNVRCDGLAGISTFDEKYEQAAKEIKDRIVALGERAAGARCDALRDDIQAQVDEAEQQLELVKAQAARLGAAGPEIEQGEAQVAEAQRQLDEFEQRDWSVTLRTQNAGVSNIITFSRMTDRLSVSMAALFVIVGLLVSYFAVCRIVHEQIIQIGTKKALGFRTGEITKSYLWYSGIAVLVGVIVGAIVAFVAVERIVGDSLANVFAFGAYPAFFGWPLFFGVAAVELVLILGTTYLACRGVLRRNAIDLLQGETPPVGKQRFYERWSFWSGVPLLIQTIVNNCVNDKRRMRSTIAGIAGSTAIIVTAITLNNNILGSYDRHYENVYGFNTIAYVDSGVDGAASNVETALRDKGATAASVRAKRCIVDQPDGESEAMRILVSLDEEAFGKVYHVNAVDGSKVDLAGDGAWVSQAYAEHMGAKVGDTIVIDEGNGTKHKVPILGFYEFWLLYHEMVMGADYYQREFGDVSANAVFARASDFGSAKEAVEGVEGFDSVIDDAAEQHERFEMFSKVSGAVVVIYLALAVLMAVVVQLNLNAMFIEEKRSELIVLMINGYSLKDAENYVSYDSIALTLLGMIGGCYLGGIMGTVTIAVIEPAAGVFLKGADAPAMAIGLLSATVLAFVMGKIALRRVRKFKLTEINSQ